MKIRLIFIAVLALIPVLIASSNSNSDKYLSPGELALSPDGRSLYVVCERSDELRVVDIQSGKITGIVPVGHVPRGVSLSPDAQQLYVTSSWTDRVEVIDAPTLKVVRELATGFEPISAVPDRTGSTLYVANRVSNDMSVIDLKTGDEIKRLTAGRGTSYLAASADGKNVYATHVFPNLGAQRTAPESEITVIDPASQRVSDRIRLHNIGGVFHIATSADGKLTAVAQLRPKNLIPLAHVEHGAVFGNSLSVFGEGFNGVVQVPLDELERYFAMPLALRSRRTTRGYTFPVRARTCERDRTTRLAASPARTGDFANDLSASANYVTARIAVGKNPRGIALSPDGRRLYVANRMDDTIGVIDTQRNTLVSTIDLGGAKEVTPMRKGEQIFNTAKYGFQGHFGCANCHIDGTFDGMEWDLEPDGFGVDVVDNRLLEDLSGTEPFKWNGGNPNMPTECGPRTEKYFYRSQSYNDQE